MKLSVSTESNMSIFFYSDEDLKKNTSLCSQKHAIIKTFHKYGCFEHGYGDVTVHLRDTALPECKTMYKVIIFLLILFKSVSKCTSYT